MKYSWKIVIAVATLGMSGALLHNQDIADPRFGLKHGNNFIRPVWRVIDCQYIHLSSIQLSTFVDLAFSKPIVGCFEG